MSPDCLAARSVDDTRSTDPHELLRPAWILRFSDRPRPVVAWLDGQGREEAGSSVAESKREAQRNICSTAVPFLGES